MAILSATAKKFLVVSGVSVVYFFAARLGLMFAYETTQASPIWFASGIGLAAAMLHGKWGGLGVFIGATSANFTTLTGVETFSSLLVCSAIGIGNMAEAMIGSSLIRRWIGPGFILSRAGNVFKFFFSSVLACCVASLVGPTFLALVGVVSYPDYIVAAFTWWLGDLSGIILITPVILIAYKYGLTAIRKIEVVDAIVYNVAAFIIASYVFSSVGGEYPIAFLVIPYLLWIQYRYGMLAALVPTVLVCISAMWHTVSGGGLFAISDQNTSFLILDSFILTACLTVMTFGGVLFEEDVKRRDIHTRLEKAQKQLDMISSKVEEASSGSASLKKLKELTKGLSERGSVKL